jgi:hypothetical protein
MRFKASNLQDTANSPGPMLAVTAPCATSASAAMVAELTGTVKCTTRESQLDAPSE